MVCTEYLERHDTSARECATAYRLEPCRTAIESSPLHLAISSDRICPAASGRVYSRPQEPSSASRQRTLCSLNAKGPRLRH